MTPSATHSSEIHDSTPSGESDDEMMMRRRKHAKVGSAVEGLNLTAMMDIFTIILVFLIKQYEAAPQNITLSEDLSPPLSTTTAEMVPGVSLIISKTSVMVDNKRIVVLADGKPTGTEGWGAVGKALGARRETIKYIGDHGGSQFDGNVMVIADEKTPYDVVSNVLYQAGKEQFTTYRLILRAGGTE
ncbi:hypothetical protein LBMAG42_04250 [Deltaproteobacteria bacterium]|nr:hypothetical protein LBMAG42_04250 [Deltaproteobacteria bacterium]